MTDFVGAGFKPAPTKSIDVKFIDTKSVSIKRHSLSEIVRAFKTFSARHINAFRDAEGEAVWQRNYYEHIVRNDTDLERIETYIRYNPLRWEADDENPNTLL